MNVSETTGILAMVAAQDRRTVGEIDIEVWHDALNDLTFPDCQQAVRDLIRNSGDWITPYAVRSGVRRIRADRVSRAMELPPDADPDDVQAYIEALRDGRKRTASGTRSIPAAQLLRVFRSVELARPSKEDA